MSHRNSNIWGGVALRLSLRLMMLATMVAGGFATVVSVPAAMEDDIVLTTSCLIETHDQIEPCNVDPNHNKKQGPYIYGNNTSYPNATPVSTTITLTLTSTDVTTETVVSPIPVASLTTQTTDASVSDDTSTSIVMVTVIPYSTFHAETVTVSYNSTLVSSDVDGQTNSVPDSSSIQHGPTVTTNTVISLTSGYTDNSSTPNAQSSAVQVTKTTRPHVTVTTTTTIWHSASDCEEYTGTETVTVTPYATITKGTTVTLSSTTRALESGSTITETNQSLVNVTETVYVSPPSTQAQTGAVGISVSTRDITVSDVTTTTVVQTVSPVPTEFLTTNCTGSAMISSRSTATNRSTLTITVNPGSLISTNDVSAFGITVGTSTATTTVPHASYPVSDTLLGSVVVANGTGAITVEMVTVSGNVTMEFITQYTPFAYTPNLHHTYSTVTAYSSNTISPATSGGDSSKKRPVRVFWGDSDGGCSHTCIILLVMIISLFL
ncbi:hypothetical protein F5Y12DRAFT_528575 [Xylaria sp. FL1777]|nr:hypothetical protein F5Y12DRAFT_528575 [Xylaria sp. FL1777]